MGDSEFFYIKIFWVTVEFATFALGRAIIFEYAIIIVSKHFYSNFFVHSTTTWKIKINAVEKIILTLKFTILQRLMYLRYANMRKL